MDRVSVESRRNYQRLSTEIAVPFRIDRDGGGEWQEARALNLSAGGVLLRAPRPSDGELEGLLAERCRLALTLGIEQRTLHVTARLVWSEDIKGTGECRLGLRFLDLDGADQEYLWRWVLTETERGTAN